MSTLGITTEPDGKKRCWWHGGHADYIAYHDDEWGFPVADDRRLFEKICLEGFQAGLSWLTILRKRQHFREAFAGFDFESVARFGKREVTRLLKNEGIVRHRGKIESTINNAQRAMEIAEASGGLAAYFWCWEPPKKERPKKLDHASLSTLAKTPTSIALSKDLKKRGWSFVGPTTVYAFMQAMGLVNDHLQSCHCRKEVEEERKRFVRPQ